MAKRDKEMVSSLRTVLRCLMSNPARVEAAISLLEMEIAGLEERTGKADLRPRPERVRPSKEARKKAERLGKKAAKKEGV